MDSRKNQEDPSLVDLNFHYDRDKRLKQKEKFKKKKENKTRNWLFILLKVLALIIVINLITYFTFYDTNSKSFSFTTKEMIFKEEILIEVTLKSKIEGEQELFVSLEKENFKTPVQTEILSPKEEKILYFSLPYEEISNYILIIVEGVNRYSWEKNF